MMIEAFVKDIIKKTRANGKFVTEIEPTPKLRWYAVAGDTCADEFVINKQMTIVLQQMCVFTKYYLAPIGGDDDIAKLKITQWQKWEDVEIEYAK